MFNKITVGQIFFRFTDTLMMCFFGQFDKRVLFCISLLKSKKRSQPPNGIFVFLCNGSEKKCTLQAVFVRKYGLYHIFACHPSNVFTLHFRLCFIFHVCLSPRAIIDHCTVVGLKTQLLSEREANSSPGSSRFPIWWWHI